MIDALVSQWKQEPWVIHGLKLAFVEKQPEQGLGLLKEILVGAASTFTRR